MKRSKFSEEQLAYALTARGESCGEAVPVTTTHQKSANVMCFVWRKRAPMTFTTGC